MSVTIGFVPMLLIYGVSVGVASLVEARTSRSIPKEILRENKQSQEEMLRLMFPNLYASRQQKSETFDEAECIQAALEDAERPRAFTRQTVIQDLDLAARTAESLGGRTLPLDDGVAFLYKDCGFVLFHTEPGKPFDLWILGTTDAETATSLAEEIETEYRRLVQDRVHAALLERSAQYGLSLESEEVQEDNSIVLTFTV